MCTLPFSSANYIVALSTNNQACNIIISKRTLEETAIMSEQQQSRPLCDFFCIPKIIDDLASVLTDILIAMQMQIKTSFKSVVIISVPAELITAYDVWVLNLAKVRN